VRCLVALGVGYHIWLFEAGQSPGDGAGEERGGLLACLLQDPRCRSAEQTDNVPCAFSIHGGLGYVLPLSGLWHHCAHGISETNSRNEDAYSNRICSISLSDSHLKSAFRDERRGIGGARESTQTSVLRLADVEGSVAEKGQKPRANV
jgi:hypothetical protein